MLKQIKESPKLQEYKTRYPTANVVVIFFAIIMLWRGFWGLLDIYLFPGSPTLSSLVCILTGVIVLYLDDFSINNLKR